MAKEITNVKKKKVLEFSPLQPWLVSYRHVDTLQKIQLVSVGRNLDEVKSHVVATIPKNFRDKWEFIDINVIMNKNFVCAAPYVFPESLSMIVI